MGMNTNNTDSEKLLQSAETAGEKLTFALIIRGTSDDIRKLKQYVDENNFTIVFKKFSTDNLYCINNAEYVQFMQQQKQ